MTGVFGHTTSASPLPLFAAIKEDARAPLVLSYGMGVDSTAVLVGWRRLGLRPDLVLFADTGSEHRRTYRYRAVIEDWLVAVGFPPLTAVRYRPRHGRYTTLVEDCLIKGVLPSLAYGSKACSQKWKVGPQNAFLRTWPPALAAWPAPRPRHRLRRRLEGHAPRRRGRGYRPGAVHLPAARVGLGSNPMRG